MVLPLSDLLDAGTVNGNNVQVLTGYAPTLPFEPRVMADPNHGDLIDLDGDGVDEFYSTRVLIDMTVSQLESQQFNPPLPVNSLGLPRAEVVNLPNVVMRVPTKVNAGAGQFTVLRNPSGGTMSFVGNGSNDPGSPTLDVIRAFRSASAELGDPNNGFLVDANDPILIGVQGINVLAVSPLGGADISVDFQFGTVACATAPRVGDVIELSGGIAEVTVNGTTPVGGLAQGVQMKLLVGDTMTFIPSPGQFLTTWDPSLTQTPECFLLFNPSPTQPPAAGILPTSTVTVRFSEPVDPESVKAFDSFFIQKQNVPASQFFKRKIVGQVVPSLDLREFTFVPRLPLPHMPGGQEQYDVTLISQAGGGVVDLAGNQLRDDLPLVTIRMDPNGATSRTDGLSWTFNQPDEDGDGLNELRGQFTYDLAAGRIKSRAVTRFSAVADQSQPVVAVMIPFTAPIQTPLSNFGSKMMTVWRYHDVGFSLMDDLTMNLDVESLSWAPFSGVQIDNFDNFALALSHSKYLPDEVINQMSLLPAVPLSGITKTYDDNPIDGRNVVHPKQNGYSLNPIDTYVSSTGTQMFPWPMNRNLPPEQFSRFTWRDTCKLMVGGKSGQGVDTGILTQVTGLGMLWYTANNVPTIGLPLLMEFRTTADTGAFGLNGFKINIALNSSARPVLPGLLDGRRVEHGRAEDRRPGQRAGRDRRHQPGHRNADRSGLRDRQRLLHRPGRLRRARQRRALDLVRHVPVQHDVRAADDRALLRAPAPRHLGADRLARRDQRLAAGDGGGSEGLLLLRPVRRSAAPGLARAALHRDVPRRGRHVEHGPRRNRRTALRAVPREAGLQPRDRPDPVARRPGPRVLLLVPRKNRQIIRPRSTKHHVPSDA